MFYYNSLFEKEVLFVYVMSSTVYLNGSSLDNWTDAKHNNFSNNMMEDNVSERVKYLQNVNKHVWLIFAPILLIIGLMGNILSILVLQR